MCYDPLRFILCFVVCHPLLISFDSSHLSLSLSFSPSLQPFSFSFLGPLFLVGVVPDSLFSKKNVLFCFFVFFVLFSSRSLPAPRKGNRKGRGKGGEAAPFLFLSPCCFPLPFPFSLLPPLGFALSLSDFSSPSLLGFLFPSPFFLQFGAFPFLSGFSFPSLSGFPYSFSFPSRAFPRLFCFHFRAFPFRFSLVLLGFPSPFFFFLSGFPSPFQVFPFPFRLFLSPFFSVFPFLFQAFSFPFRPSLFLSGFPFRALLCPFCLSLSL